MGLLQLLNLLSMSIEYSASIKMRMVPIHQQKKYLSTVRDEVETVLRNGI